MGVTVVVYDACVLYPAPLRSLLMYLAMSGLYQARWTDDIHEEWMRNVQKDYPDITRKQVERIRDLMNAHVPDCVVTGYAGRIAALALPDPDDRHVLAAATHCRASVIVTFNVRHFPGGVLKAYGVEAQHPDEFVKHQFKIASDLVCSAARQQRQGLKNPPLTVEEYLAVLDRQGLKQTVAALRSHAASL